ncbi:MAG: hypothetical protein MZV63_07010 [Marinilabiliales bacterium]|nr:hypothetical protein [Marinilabiliales bacterium]
MRPCSSRHRHRLGARHPPVHEVDLRHQRQSGKPQRPALAPAHHTDGRRADGRRGNGHHDARHDRILCGRPARMDVRLHRRRHLRLRPPSPCAETWDSASHSVPGLKPSPRSATSTWTGRLPTASEQINFMAMDPVAYARVTEFVFSDDDVEHGGSRPQTATGRRGSFIQRALGKVRAEGRRFRPICGRAAVTVPLRSRQSSWISTTRGWSCRAAGTT